MKKIALLLICFGLVLHQRMRAENAPVTMATNITNAVPGASSVAISIPVTGFSDIGQFTLTMKFDTTRIRFISAIPNPDLPFMGVTYSSPVGNTKGMLVFSWTGGSNISLADGASLVNLTFSYVTGTGLLSWAYTYGAVCQYKRYVSGTLTTLDDNPKYHFYLNGGISNRGAPVTYAPLITLTGPGNFQLPVTADNFTGIGALTLYLEYDPAIITYLNTFVKNPAFGTTFQVGNITGTGGKMLLIIQWYGNPVTLANGSALCTCNFNYIFANGTTTALKWFDNISSCEYADGPGDVLIDLPQNYYYHDGVVAPPLVANFMADNLTPVKNAVVSFTDLTAGGATSWNWSFDRETIVFVNGTSAASQNPRVEFTEGGLYSVTLLASTAYLSDTEIKPGYLRAGVPGLWTGIISTAWSTETNWDNWLVPDGLTAVVIPPTAANWPVFDGDLILGISCNSLVLSGTTSQMTVTGNLTIP